MGIQYILQSRNGALSDERTGSCLFYEKTYVLRCRFRIPLRFYNILLRRLSYYIKKGRFFMEKIKQNLGISPLNAKRICVLGMLTALTCVLGMYCTVRIGAGIKISFKFISVFFTSVLFGPLWGGAVCAASDIISYAVNPVAAFMPTITFSEFLYGFTDGLFYHNVTGGRKSMIWRIILCVVLQMIFINIFLTSYFLIPVMGLNYSAMIMMRIPAAAVNCLIRIFTLIFISRYISQKGMTI